MAKPGDKFFFLTIMRKAEPCPRGSRYWICRCDCGNEKRIAERALLYNKGRTKSCGCKTKFLLRVARIKHGHRIPNKTTAEYHAWMQTSKKQPNEWASFEEFLEDVGEKPDPDYVLIRPDRTKPWGPGNAYWGTKAEAARYRAGTKLITWDGRTLSAKEWSRRLGLGKDTVSRRLRKGWTLEEAMTRPMRPVSGPVPYKLRHRKKRQRKNKT